MTTAISVYQTSDGRILYSDEIADGTTPSLGAELAYIAGAYDGGEYYVSGGVAAVRPILVDDGAEYTLMGDGTTTQTIALVSGTKVIHDHTTYTSSGSETLQIRGRIDGDFEFEIIPPFPYQDATITVSIDAV
jgi:hypothetical protein